MNPDVFITIVFAGLAAAVALVALVFVLRQMRRDHAPVVQSTDANEDQTMKQAGHGAPH